MSNKNIQYRPNNTVHKDPKHQYQGAVNRQAGKNFETLIDASLRFYELGGKVCIEKTPEPMSPIKNLGQGKFIAHYVAPAQPDYKGTMVGGKSVVFEAKHTMTDRIEQTRITDAQAARLDKHEHLGAMCFVLVGFSMQQFFRIPWSDWKNMKLLFNHKYATAAQLREYAVPVTPGGAILIFSDNKR